jgi:hypothetical protein
MAVGGAVAGKVVTILIKAHQSNGLTNDEKQQLQDIVLATVKKLLLLSTITNQADLIKFAVEQISEELDNEKIVGFSVEEITLAVQLVINAVNNRFNNNPTYAKYGYVNDIVSELTCPDKIDVVK